MTDYKWFDENNNTVDIDININIPLPIPIEIFQTYYNGSGHMEKDGDMFWFNSDGLLHRDNDEPAITLADGTCVWMENNQIHRENDKPAIIRSCGILEWYYKGQRHRHEDKYLRYKIQYNYQGYEFKLNDISHWVKKDYEYKPAIIYPDGSGICYYFGNINNIYGAAMIAVVNNKKYYKYYLLGTNIKYSGYINYKKNWDYYNNPNRKVRLPTF